MVFFDEAFVGWLVGKDAVMHIHTVTAARDTRQGIDMKQSCNQNACTRIGLLKVSGLSLSVVKFCLDPQERRKKSSKRGFLFCFL